MSASTSKKGGCYYMGSTTFKISKTTYNPYKRIITKRTRYHKSYCPKLCCGSANSGYCCGDTSVPAKTIAGLVSAVAFIGFTIILFACCRRRRSTPSRTVLTHRQSRSTESRTNGNIRPGHSGTANVSPNPEYSRTANISSNPEYTGTANVSPFPGYSRTANISRNPEYNGTGTVSPMPGCTETANISSSDQSQMVLEELNAGMLRPPAYETLANTPDYAPPSYSSIYKP